MDRDKHHTSALAAVLVRPALKGRGIHAQLAHQLDIAKRHPAALDAAGDALAGSYSGTLTLLVAPE
jgi:hypothetical protein